jgi:hypothetical protein
MPKIGNQGCANTDLECLEQDTQMITFYKLTS